MRYRWILFDADGTLFDFAAAQSAALSRTWSAAGLDEPDDLLERFERINGDLWRAYEEGAVTQERLRRDRFARLLAEAGTSADPDELGSTYLVHLGTEGRLFAGAKQLLAELAGRASLALVTNGIADVQRSRLARSGVGACFSAVVISGEIGVAKPDPRFFDAAFAAVGEPEKRDVVIVGDSLSSDIRGGLDYGIDTCWFNPRRAVSADGVEPRFTVAGYDELRRVLETGEAAPASAPSGRATIPG